MLGIPQGPLRNTTQMWLQTSRNVLSARVRADHAQVPGVIGSAPGNKVLVTELPQHSWMEEGQDVSTSPTSSPKKSGGKRQWSRRQIRQY